MKQRRRLSPQEAEFLGFSPKEKEGVRNPRYRISPEQYASILKLRGVLIDDERSDKTTTDTNYYGDGDLMPSAWDSERECFYSIKEYCDKYNLPFKDVHSYKLVNFPRHYYNIAFKENIIGDTSQITEELLEDIAKKIIIPRDKPISVNELDADIFSRAIYTDVHIGMDPNRDGFALYGGRWDKDMALKRCDEFCEFILRKAKGQSLILDDLGDLVDGWDGKTVRKQHDLQQNMTNQEMFDAAVLFKIQIAENLSDEFEEIVFNNICEDNHAGAFGYVVNSSFKAFAETRYSNVKVNNHQKFISHYFVGKHCFVISHGKDARHLKVGFKPKLNADHLEKIENYLRSNKLYQKSKYIEFSKGDSHQLLLDFSSSDWFDYCNYPAFSPSSEWVQTNYKKGRSGFVLWNIPYEDNDKEILPYFFDD